MISDSSLRRAAARPTVSKALFVQFSINKYAAPKIGVYQIIK
jgi:hypothetical protein